MCKHKFTTKVASKQHRCTAWHGTDEQWCDWAGRINGRCNAVIAKGDTYSVVHVKGHGRFSMCENCTTAGRIVYPNIPLV